MPTDDQPSKPKTVSRLTEAALIAATPALAYGLALAYERGIASHFGYPESLIDVSFGNALLNWGGILSTALIVFFTLLMLSKVLHLRGSLLLGLLLSQTAAVWFLNAWGTRLLTRGLPPRWLWNTLSLVFIALGLLQLIRIVVISFRDRAKGLLTVWEGLVTASARRTYVKGSVFDVVTDIPAIARTLGVSILLIALGLGLVGFAKVLGAGRASNQTDFPVFADSVLLLRAYGDYYVGTPLPRDSAKTPCRYLLLSKADLRGSWITIRRVGRLNTARRQPDSVPGVCGS